MPNAANNTLSYTHPNLTELFEAVKLVAYQDQRKIWTIGVGHTGPEVHSDLIITHDQATAYLLVDIQVAANCIKRYCNVALNQAQFDALVDFTFNVGCGAFERSTLLKLLNKNDFVGTAKQFEVWDKVSGVENKGLLRRRLAEEELFEHGIIPKNLAA